jgi:hypothetical protein
MQRTWADGGAISLPRSQDSYHESLRAKAGAEFPTRDQWWWGCVLDTLTCVACGDMSTEWTGGACSLNHDADAAAISFDADRVVAAIYRKGGRSSIPPGGSPIAVENYLRGPDPNFAPLVARHPVFAGMPSELREQACTSTLPALLFYEEDRWLPYTITAAFWGMEGRMSAAEPWPDVYAHGADLLAWMGLLDDPDEALAELDTRWVMSAEQAAVIRDLYSRLRVRPGVPLTMTAGEVATLAGAYARPDWLQWLRTQMAAIGITVP